MLIIVDLHQEEELSSSSTGKVAGGETASNGISPQQAGDFMEDASIMFQTMGLAYASYDAGQSAAHFWGLTAPR